MSCPCPGKRRAWCADKLSAGTTPMQQLSLSSSLLCSGAVAVAIGGPQSRHSGRINRAHHNCFQRRAHARLVVLDLGKLQEAR